MAYQGHRLHGFIIGGTPTGTLYGVYELLQNQCGVWWLASDCTVVPKNAALTIHDQDSGVKPTIWSREFYHAQYNGQILPAAKARWEALDRHNRLTQASEDIDPSYRLSYRTGAVCHSFYRYVPPSKYFKDHPEYFSMNREGRRSCLPSGQLCLTNPDVKRIVMEQWEAWIKADRQRSPAGYPTLYDFSQEDNTDFICCCPECRKASDRYGGDGGLVLHFVNDVAGRMKKKYPDVTIRTFAYVSSEKPPRGIQPADNVVVRYCDLYGKSNHLLPLTHPANRGQEELLRQWCSRTNNVELWDYILGDSAAPDTAIDAIAADARLFKEIGLSRVFVESEFRPWRPQPFYALQYFVQCQCFLDADQDLERLVRVFIDGYYGAAAPEMTEYLAFLRKSIKDHPTASMIDWNSRILAHVNLDMLAKSREMLLKAYTKDASAAVHGRVARELSVVDYALFRELRKHPAKAEQRDAILKEYAGYMRVAIGSLDDSEANRDCYRKDLDAQIALLNLKFTGLPDELEKTPDSDLRYLAWPQFFIDLNGKRVKDPDSTMPWAMAWQPEGQGKFKLPLGIGVYDRRAKTNTGFSVQDATQDEKYHWRKLGRVEVRGDSIIWVLDWQVGFSLKDFYTAADGMEESPNIYDLWLSMKFQGPGYVKDSIRPNGFYMDRALLVRPPRDGKSRLKP